ncbi:PQQ-binding-like beta-propeller repeat protein [Streptomyces sp. NPDC050161]|uniref:protein kinase domain-containing protein n=1 Tax=Streptomyces sp. NPDC050161 TaxID=3365604 RepID=UPI0037A46878
MGPLRDLGLDPEAERPEYAGQYRLEARLGAGGMGVVHLARSSSGLLLAVKVIHAEFAQDPEFRGRFRQEVAAARRVSGAFTAPVVDADPDAGRPWMATLHIPGPTLSDHVKRNGPLALGEVRRLASGLAEALRDIHRAGVVHRDLKPGNVLLAADGPKVIDFGISRPSDSEMRTETGKLIGTPPFMAPEQFQRPREVGPQADVFALGSVLVHAATGSGPFDSESPYLVAYQVVHDEADLAGVPDELAPLIAACLAKDPAHRPTPDALMDLLRTDLPTPAHTDLPDEPRDTPGENPRNAWAPYAALPEAAPGPAPGTVPEATPDGFPDRFPDGFPDAVPHAIPEAAPEPRIPGQRRPVRVESAPPPIPADATHVRARSPLTTPPPAAPANRADDDSPPSTTDHPRSVSPSPTTKRRRRRRAWPVWAAAALIVAGAGTFAGVRALSGGDPTQPTRPPRAADEFRPWRTTLVHRPAGYRAEMPACAPGAAHGDGPDALFCVQPGLLAARVDADTGTVRWRRTGPRRGPQDAPPTPPVLSGGLLYVTSPDGTRIDAIDPSPDGHGATRWSKDLTGYKGGSAVVGNVLLLTADDGTVTALDSASHRRLWRKPFPGHTLPSFKTYGAPTLAYAAEPSTDGSTTRVTAIDPRHGTVRWHTRLTGSLTPVGTGTSGTLYLTAADPKFTFRTTAVVRYDPKRGRSERLPLAAPLDGVTATVHGETAYLLAEGGALQAVGERRWDVETSVARGSSPVATADNRLYLTSADGRLLAVDTRTGGLTGQTRARLTAARHNGFLESLPAPVPDPLRGRVYAAAPDGTVFGTSTKDPSTW